MPADMQIPMTTSQRFEADGFNKKFPLAADSPKWYDKKFNEEWAKKYFWGAPIDTRFPQQNKSKWCWTSFVDYHRCKTLKGDDYAPCEYFKNIYMDVCPRFWVEKWNDWVDEGRFPARFDK